MSRGDTRIRLGHLARSEEAQERTAAREAAFLSLFAVLRRNGNTAEVVAAVEVGGKFTIDGVDYWLVR